MLIVSIFTGIYYWIMKTDVGYAITHAIRQPLFSALLIGLVMGDVKQAVIIGAAVQILYIGLVAAGSNLPADDCLAGLIAIPIALKSGLSPELAIAIAVPVGVMGVFVDQLRKTINVIFVHMADKYAEDANTQGIMRCAFLYPALMGFLLRFPLVFVATYYGESVVQRFLSIMPGWLLHSFEIVGGILPALGFAITIMVIGKKHLIPFFILGYFGVKYLNIDVMAAAIFGACFALLFTYLNAQRKAQEG